MFDSSAYGNTGYFSSGTSATNIVPGFSGNGLRTSQAPSAYLCVPTSASLSSTGAFTLMAWLRHDTGLSHGLPDQGFGGVEKKDARLRMGWSGWGSGFLSEGWNCKLNSGSSPEVVAAISIAAGEWQHVACSYDGNTLSLYVNGTLVVSKGIGSVAYGGAGDLTIGATVGQIWNGTMDEVRFYNRALSRDEIATFIPQSSSTQHLVEAAKKADAFVDSIGVNLHDYPFQSIVVPRLQELGVRHVRDGLVSNSTNELQGEMQTLLANGVKYSLIADSRFQSPAVAQQNIRTMVANLAPYGNPVEYVEGPNEPDNFQPGNPNIIAETRQYAIDLYNAMKADSVTAGIPLMAPSMSTVAGWSGLGDISAWVDYGNGHAYSSASYPGTPILGRELEYFNVPTPNRPLYVTETGYHTAVPSGYSEAVQGKYTSRRVLELYNRGIPRIYIYDLVDDGPNATSYNDRHGIVRQDGTPKPAFNALKNLITLLKEPGASFTPTALDYTLQAATPDLHRLLLQKSNGDYYLLLWYETPGTDATVTTPVHLRFNTPIAQAVLYSPTESTNPTNTYPAPTELLLDVPDKVVVLKLTPA